MRQGLVGVAGEDALVEALDGGERRAVPEQHVEELEPAARGGRARRGRGVSGVERISPMGPQSHDQKMAATTTEMGDSPVLWPYT